MKRRLFLSQSGSLALAAATANPWLSTAHASSSIVVGQSAALDLGYTSMRFSKSERTGSRFVDLSLASRTAGLV